MQAVIAMGEHDSFADFGRAAKAAARSSRLQKLLLTLGSSVVLWVAAYVKGWEASLVYAPRAKRLERRIGALEDAGVGADPIVDKLDREVFGDRAHKGLTERLDEHITEDEALEQERWRGWLRSMIADTRRLEEAQRKYDAELGRKVPANIAAERALGYARPPGR